MSEKRTVRLDELDADQRRLVLALIDAGKTPKVTNPAALKKLAGLLAPAMKRANTRKPEPRPSPEKPSGAAHSKEQRT